VKKLLSLNSVLDARKVFIKMIMIDMLKTRLAYKVNQLRQPIDVHYAIKILKLVIMGGRNI
jgi:hypothetical protein